MSGYCFNVAEIYSILMCKNLHVVIDTAAAASKQCFCLIWNLFWKLNRFFWWFHFLFTLSQSLCLVSLTSFCHWHCWLRLLFVIDTAESDFFLSLTLLSLTSCCHWQRWVRLLFVIDTAESDFFLSLTLLSLTSCCQWHPWVRLLFVIDTAEPDFMLSLTPLSLTSCCH